MAASPHSVSRSAYVAPGPTLQNREVIAHQRLEIGRRLIVRRMRFEDELADLRR